MEMETPRIRPAKANARHSRLVVNYGGSIGHHLLGVAEVGWLVPSPRVLFVR
jgi:hypothetical protein